MARWDGRWWRDERGRFARKGDEEGAYISIRRTVANPRAASDDELLDVFMRITVRAKRGKRDERELAALDAELARRSAPGEPELTPEQRRVDELVAAGESWEEAYAQAYGNQGRRQGDSDRRRGESSEKARRRLYREVTYLQMLQAEEVTRGHLLNKHGKAKGIDPARLFSGTQATAEKYASEELLRFWRDVSTRRTYAEFRAERTGDATGARKARAARVQASAGKEFA